MVIMLKLFTYHVITPFLLQINLRNNEKVTKHQSGFQSHWQNEAATKTVRNNVRYSDTKYLS